MHFFIVDNGSVYTENIVNIITDGQHTYNLQSYDINNQLVPSKADCIILSGGIKQNYEQEYQLIQTTSVPIFGICIGMQLIVKAFGGTIRELTKQVYTDTKCVQLNEVGQSIFGKKQLIVHEKHRYVIDTYEQTGLQILGESDDGIEIIYHPSKPIIGAQFHPEVTVSPDSNDIFWKFIQQVTGSKELIYAQ